MSTALAALAGAYPSTRAQVVHLSTAAQLSALRADQLDLGLLREHPIGPEFDAVLVVEEPLGVLLASNHAPDLTGPQGIRLDALAGMDWVRFPRSDSPAWYDELTAILRSHGVDPGDVASEGQGLIAEVKFAAVATGRAFALAPAGWSQPVPTPCAGRRWWAIPSCGEPGQSGALSHIAATWGTWSPASRLCSTAGTRGARNRFESPQLTDALATAYLGIRPVHTHTGSFRLQRAFHRQRVLERVSTSMTWELSETSALVTGATSGIG
ncbi:MAG TPA: LysR family substrate-binding domain-containing protein [Mycobacterium sp.]|nr:LysR family substrate-binding domain-containing protein [Mycobacterium sp.]